MTNPPTQAHKLTGERLRLREVVTIDIANDPVKNSDYKADEDPTKFKSQKTGRGPLVGPQWWKKVGITGCCSEKKWIVGDSKPIIVT